MEKKIVILVLFILCSNACAQTKEQQTMDEWNRFLCLAIKAIQSIAVVLGVFVLIYAGIKYMTSAEDLQARKESKELVIQVLAGMLLLLIASEIVNYIVLGTNVKPFDSSIC